MDGRGSGGGSETAASGPARASRAALALSACCLVAEVVGFTQIERLRELEAAVGAVLVGLLMGSSYHQAGSPLVFYPVGDGRYRALEITWQCSSFVAATPILLVTGLAVLLPNARPRTMAALLAVGLLIVAAANQLRLLVIAVATRRWGDEGFELSHRVVGSGIVLLSVIATLGLIVRAHAARPVSARAEETSPPW